jgi:hypothetical protein
MRGNDHAVGFPLAAATTEKEFMVKMRRRFKQSMSLAERLNAQAVRLRNRASNLPPGMEQTELWRKVRQAETALRIDQWLSSTEVPAADDVATVLDKSHPKRLSSKSSQGQT